MWDMGFRISEASIVLGRDTQVVHSTCPDLHRITRINTDFNYTILIIYYLSHEFNKLNELNESKRDILIRLIRKIC
jgi:hypothetical protein